LAAAPQAADGGMTVGGGRTPLGDWVVCLMDSVAFIEMPPTRQGNRRAME